MTAVVESLKKSNVWSETWSIPLVPQHANPHIYTAYTMRILESPKLVDTLDHELNLTIEILDIRANYRRFLDGCEGLAGVITTFPGGMSEAGLSSHDDAYGASYLLPDFAKRCAVALEMNDGVYGIPPLNEKRNFYRFLFVRSAMRSWAGFRIGLLSQASYIASLLFHLIFTKDGDTSGHLLLWLSFPTMRQYPMCKTAIDFWAARWTKAGYTPKSIFAKHYLTECPWFAEYARDDWS